MVLIFSESSDNSTSSVIEWLKNYNSNYIRFNRGDENVQLTVNEHNELAVKFNSQIFTLDDVKSSWFRRSFLKFFRVSSSEYKSGLNVFNEEELHWFTDYFLNKLSDKKSINTAKTLIINKLLVLEKAIEIGFNVPEYFFANNLKKLKRSKSTEYITKGINGNPFINISELETSMRTEILNKKSCPEKFYPTFIQEYIKKKYELRIFYLHEKIWSMAIFSQNDEKTKYDFRNYNKKNPNRFVPYNIPIKLKNKIILLMKALNLNSGSIDIIVTEELEYYFLEVNPVGQFGMVSIPCNYNIEKEIALFLIEDEKKS